MEKHISSNCYYLIMDLDADYLIEIKIKDNKLSFITACCFIDENEIQIWDHSDSFDKQKDNYVSDFIDLLKEAIDKDYLKLGQIISRKDIYSIYNDDLAERIYEEFISEINKDPYVIDPYFDYNYLEDNKYEEYLTKTKITELYTPSFCQTLILFAIYLLSYSEISIYLNSDCSNQYDYNQYKADDAPNRPDLFVDNFDEIYGLITSVINIGGGEYEYNDGSYFRTSGYTFEGHSFTIDATDVDCFSSILDDAIEIDKKWNPNLEDKNKWVDYVYSSSIDKLNHKPPRIYLAAKRMLIKWLRDHKPLGINNLTKLTKYLNI